MKNSSYSSMSWFFGTISLVFFLVTSCERIPPAEPAVTRPPEIPSAPPPVPEGAAVLKGDYEDVMQQEIPFGRRSYYLAPWRSYMDTWPASRFLDCLGINFNVRPGEAEAVAAMLEDTGVRVARVEMGWGNFDYEHPEKLTDYKEKEFTQILQALKKHNIRPLILLNANSGWPCPAKGFRVKLKEKADVGARDIFLDKTDSIVLHRTGLRGQAYQCAFPLILSADKESGRCELSAPLRKAIEPGQIDLVTLRYAPFGGKVFVDGTANPAAEETLRGWMLYVSGVCNFAKQALGTAGSKDAGFDLEVWNEYTFGSQFLEDKHYYDPAPKYKEAIAYTGFGLTRKGHEIILPMTVDYVNNPANDLPGVKVISGFSNQRPWENGVDMWPGQTGFSRHYYTGSDVREFAPDKLDERDAKSGPVNALGKTDGRPDGKEWHTVVPGTFFVPKLDVSMPEWWEYGYKTEFMTRDIQPFIGPWPKHYRYGHPGTGQNAELWMTEFNYWRSPFAESLAKQAGCDKKDTRLNALMRHLGAKAVLRSFVMHSHKGVQTIALFAAKDPDWSFGFLSEEFFQMLKQSNNELTPDAKSKAGEQAEVLKRTVELMKTGQPLQSPRKLRVDRLVELKPRLVFAGDGTPEHPDRFNRDDFACLPFQLAPDKFAIAFYVVTRNMTKSWRTEAGLLDPARYDMPEQDFDLTLGNLRGRNAKVKIFDPVTGKEQHAGVLAASQEALTVRLPTVDYPRFLIIEEERPGVQILGASLLYKADGSAKLSFTTNIPASGKVTWGELPRRISEGSAVLPEGTSHSVAISRLDINCGVQIEMRANGISCRLPMWGYDTAGARWAVAVSPEMTAVNQWRQILPLKNFNASEIVKTSTPAFERRLPPFAKETAAKSYECTPLPEGLQWKGEAGMQWAEYVKGGRRLRFDLRLESAADLNNPVTVLPETSTTDSFAVRQQDWSGFPAVRVDLVLDPTAHPGLDELQQAYYITAYKTGLLVLSAKGRKEAFNWGLVESVLKSVKLR